MKIEKLLLPFLIFITVIWFFITIKSILSPFIFSAIIAYLFSPIIKLLDKKGICRSVSSLLVIILFFSIVAIIFTNLLPVLFVQLLQFIKQLPIFVNHLMIIISNLTDLDLKEELISQDNISKLLAISDDIFAHN